MTKVNRRRVLAGTLGLGLGSAGLIKLSTDTATANVEIGALDISDKIHHSSQPDSVDLVVDTEWSVEMPYQPDKIELTLKTGQYAPDHTLETKTIDDVSSSDSGSTVVSGDLLRTSDWDISMFERDNGEIEYPVFAELVLDVFYQGEVIESKSVSDSFDLIIRSGEIETKVSLGGVGSVEVD